MQVRNRRKTVRPVVLLPTGPAERWWSDRPPLAVFVVAAVAVLGAGGVWFLMQDEPGARALAPVPRTPAVAESPPAPTETIETLDLPPLDASDDLVRDMVSSLSAHPRLASWLVSDDLVHRFVGAVVDIAGGNSPVENVDFLRPPGEFATRPSGSAVVIHEASFRRYDTMVGTFVSLDPDGAARLYRHLEPLFDEAFAYLGIPKWTFGDTFERAVDNLLAVPIPIGPIRVEEDRATFVYEDADLEELPAAAKHLIRMGPDNQRRFQAKLREIKSRIDALGGAYGP